MEHTFSFLDLLPGVAGGVARVMVGQPFDTIKVRMQVMRKGSLASVNMPYEMVYNNNIDCVKKMIKNEGIFSLYKGAVAPLLGNMLLLGIHFPIFHKVNKYLEDRNAPQNSFSVANTLVAGGTAGLAGSFVSCPVELVRTKLQMQHKASLVSINAVDFYKSTWDCISVIGRKHGIRGLYKGFVSTVVRDIQGYAWFFTAYESTLWALTDPHHSKENLNYSKVLLAGIMAGFGLWGSMYPIDTIKSKIQADNLSNPNFSGTMDCIKKTLAVEGYIGVWRGMSVALLRAIPVNGAIFIAVEGTRQITTYC